MKAVAILTGTSAHPFASLTFCRATSGTCLLLAGALIASGALNSASAQSLPSSGAGLPGSVDPGRIQERLQPAPAPADIPALISPQVPENVPPDQAAQVKITLRKLVIDGANVYSGGELAPLYAALLGKTVSLADVYRVADAVTTKYRSDGYILSRAVVPAQRIAAGEVHIRVLEGFIQNVVFNGEATPTMVAYGEIAKRSRPLRAADLERSVLLINDLPGIVGRGVLSPSPGVTGASDLTISIERSAVNAFVSLDNRGTSFVGPLQVFAEAFYNGVAGGADRLGVRYVTTPAMSAELQYVEALYSVPLGGSGATMSLSASWNRSMPGGALQNAALETEAEGEAFVARASYPMIRSRARNLAIDASFSVRNARVVQTALPSLTRLVSSYVDHIRDVRLGIAYDSLDGGQGRNFVRVEIAQGLPVLGASPNGRLTGTSRPGAIATFTKASISASRLQNLDSITPGLNLLMAVSGGLSFDQGLLASDQFAVGGTQFGRGYDPAELTGDYGVSGKFEPQYTFQPNIGPIPGFGHFGGDARIRYIQAYSFLDFGAVRDQNPRLLANPEHTRSLLSAGTGLRLDLGGRLLANAEVSKGLTRSVAAFAGRSDTRPFRFYFSAAARF